MITIFWSALKSMQPSFYPYLYQSLEDYSVSNSEIKVVDINLHDVQEIENLSRNSSLIVIDHSIHMSYSYVTDRIKCGAYYISMYSAKAPEYYLDIWNRLLSTPIVKKVLVLASDMHALFKEPTERFDGFGQNAFTYLSQVDALAWVYRPEHLPSTLDVLPDYYEAWMGDYANPLEVGNKILEHVPTLIELPLCIHPSEMSLSTGRKKWDISILGVGYNTRLIAQKKIVSDGRFSLAPYEFLAKVQHRLLSYLTRSKLLSYERITNLRYWYGHLVQERMIRKSDTSFVCGSGLKYFVRKFFEVPAGGCLMLGYMPDYARDLGFIDQENYLACRPEEVVDLLDWVKKHPKEKERIKKNGHDLIASKHTSAKRAEQFVFALTEMSKGPYKQAKFVQGDYLIER